MPNTSPPQPPQHGTWRTYTTADGLAGNEVEHLATDRDGALWIATFSSGVSRFDGDTFETFTSREGLCGNQISFILLDRHDRLWFGSLDGGVCWYDGQAFHGFDGEDGVSGGCAQWLFEDSQGRLWVAGPNTLGFYDGTHWHNLYPLCCRQTDMGGKQMCWGIVEDEVGQLWFGYKRLVLYDGARFDSFGFEHGLPGPGAYAINRGPGGAGLWVGGREVGHWDGHTYQPLPVDPVPAFGHCRKIQYDRQGRLWVCSAEGAFCYDGRQFQAFSVEGGVAHSVNGMAEDRDGQIWLGTWSGGIHCYSPNSGAVLTTRDGLPATGIMALAEDQRGQLWLGYKRFAARNGGTVYGGAAQYDGACLTQGHHKDLGGCSALYQDPQGLLWLGYERGLVCYDGDTFQRFGPEQGFPGSRVTALCQGRDGGLYIAYAAIEQESGRCHIHLIRSDGQKIHPLFDAEFEHGWDYISAMVQTDDGTLFFGWGKVLGGGRGKGKGLGRLSAQGTRSFLTTAEGLVDDRVEDLLLDRQGQLWIATVAGLSRFDGKGCENFTTADGLPHNYIHCICEDRQGHLWFGTERGVVRYNGAFFQPVEAAYIGPTRRILQDRDDTYWFGTAAGLVRYTCAATPPQIQIVQVVADREYPAAAAVDISSPSRQVMFAFKGVSFRSASPNMLYTYRLQGLEDGWQAPTRQLRIFYRELPPGQYVFQVRAIDRDLNYSEPAAVPLTVEPDPRLEGWAQVLSGGAGTEFVGTSPALRRVQSQLAQAAPTDVTMLILGETGTGKGLAARQVHHLSPRQSGPFIPVNCAGLPFGLIESELFGHEKGAFTGATHRKLGKVELAQGGTLFLDEIGDLALEAQVKLLNVLEDHRFERVGGSQTLTADVRILAATNRRLEAMVAAGTFREDLYFRLRVFEVHLPPLRQRREDIQQLANYFMERMAAHLNKPVTPLAPEVVTALQAYDWPGNVRELEHTIQRAVILCSGPIIRMQDVRLEGLPAAAELGDGSLRLAEVERRHICQVLEKTGWVLKGPKGAAVLLGLPSSTLQSRMKKLGIERPKG
ncbi:MAG: AAA domain-containing protein [Candidatus Latescibacteria bacterium]|nr:AAA domain-containing protein [Candidatus Latescibacterota bacterium]